MLHRFLFAAGCLLKYPGLIPRYRLFQKTQWLSLEELKTRQERHLVNLVNHCYEKVPYYHKLFNRIGLSPADIKTIGDLEKLPILNKRVIKSNWEDFMPVNLAGISYLNRATSGSTGTPFKYRVSKCDWEHSHALIFRDRGYAGYQLGDKIAALGCQIPLTKSPLLKKFMDFVLNQRSFYYMNVSREKSCEYFFALNQYKPLFLAGGSLPLSLFAKFLRDNGLELKFKAKAIFTNGEKLFEYQRKAIEAAIGAPVFDVYGLDDGGLSACECEEHQGLHIDMERGILEVVDGAGRQIVNQEGRVLATSLHNYALPFLRYETGDLGIINDRACGCGRGMPVLKEITGRIEGYINTTSGIKIHGSIFQAFLEKQDNISQFQVVQDTADKVVVKIVPENWELKEGIDIREIQRTITNVDPNLAVNIKFITEDELEYTRAGKYKFVINNLNTKQATEETTY
jgi:phenylacetate-CoA ligase